MHDPASHAVSVNPGDVLAGKYRVERVLGRGGMGVVVAARHLDLGELFAIKLLLPQAASQPQALDRFLREARAAARLKGEHIAKVTDMGRLENGAPYIVMEHLVGKDLRQHVAQVGPLPVGEAIELVLQACDAIAEAHAHGIIHRDLKPANLFLTRRANGTPCVKVLDFGISKHTADDAVDITRTGEIIGSPLYMAPEQMSRMKTADARADVWSMGMVLYLLLTGTTPFYTTVLTELIARVLQEDPAPPSAHRPEIPPVVDAILLHCLQKRPETRIQSIVDLANALRATGLVWADSGGRGPLPSLSGLEGSGPQNARASQSSVAVTGPADTGTLHVSLSAVPTTPMAAPGPTPMVAHTGSAWGGTGQIRAPKTSRMLVAFLAGGLAVAALLAIAIWLVVRSPNAPYESGSALAGVPTLEPRPPESGAPASAVVSAAGPVPSSGPSEATPTVAPAVTQAPTAKSTTSASVPAAATTPKPAGKKPPPAQTTDPNGRFQGIK